MKRKFWFILGMALFSAALFTAGCGSQGKTPETSDNQVVEQKITYNVGAEPETLDPAAATGMVESTIQMALFEGLVRLDAKQQPIPGMAERWDISDDGLTYTFHLRDAKWSNGDPVTAHDFEYAWKRLLDPEMANYYAYQLYYLVNGEEYNAQQAQADDVGVKALDDKTLEVKLKAPTPYFLSLTSFPNLYPVDQKVVEGNQDWHTAPESLVGNGPFKLVEWDHQQQLVLKKNENYWAADDVKLETLVITTVESEDTQLTMFDTDQIDIAESLPLPEISRLLEEKKASIYPDLGVYFYAFNTDVEPLGDVRVRRALSLAINRQNLIDHVTQAFEKPAYALVPYAVVDVNGGDFRQNGGDYFKEDVTEAKRLLADAGFPDGKGFPALKILYNTSESNQKIAEALQEMWKTNLGISVELTNQEWGVYENSVRVGDFEIGRAGWTPDYNDAMTYLDMWATSDLPIYYTGWSNPEYDQLIQKAKSGSDLAERSKAMHDAEAILMKEMPVLPIYFYTNQNLYKPWVKGVIVPTMSSYQEFRWAYVEK
ncbi:peptide ABC transporter substrate-binding protein [Candidatus Formimonas warabiya]|nr:peptide ABC transporter substrate-binding protein [Candidatus Formimonas warabiya]